MEIEIDRTKMELQVFNASSEWDLICTRTENINIETRNGVCLCKIKSINNDNDIVILTTIGLFIYHFNEINKSILLTYFYYMDMDRYNYERKKGLQLYEKVFSKHTDTLPLPNWDSFKLNDEWVSYVKNTKFILLKYGVELLTFAIKEHKLELIDDIYKKCLTYFKQDSRNNIMFLSIITSTMPLLKEYYPEYILRYSLDSTMIIDSPFYSIEHQNENLHLCSFQYPQLVNLTQSILWTRYTYYLWDNYSFALAIIQLIIIFLLLPIFPIYFAIFYILSKYHFINDIYDYDEELIYTFYRYI